MEMSHATYLVVKYSMYIQYMLTCQDPCNILNLELVKHVEYSLCLQMPVWYDMLAC